MMSVSKTIGYDETLVLLKNDKRNNKVNNLAQMFPLLQNQTLCASFLSLLLAILAVFNEYE